MRSLYYRLTMQLKVSSYSASIRVVVNLCFVVRCQLAKRSALDVLDAITFDFIRQKFEGIVAVEMDCQDILTRIILFDTNTRHARLA